MADFGENLYPVGRKDHRCEWCGQKIPKGEKHTQFKGVWEGTFQNWRMHNECYGAANQDDTLQEGFCPYEYERPAKSPHREADEVET